MQLLLQQLPALSKDLWILGILQDTGAQTHTHT